MLGLPLETWIRFFVWLIVGLVIYFTFGRRFAVVGRVKVRGRRDCVMGVGSLCQNRNPNKK